MEEDILRTKLHLATDSRQLGKRVGAGTLNNKDVPESWSLWCARLFLNRPPLDQLLRSGDFREISQHSALRP